MGSTRIKEDFDYFTELPVIAGPADLPGLLFWLDATDVTNTGAQPANNAQVSTWVDRSVNNFQFNRIDAAQSPIYQATGFKGLPTIRVDNTMDGFQAPANFSSPTGSYTIFFVGQQLENNVGGFNVYLFDLSGTNRFLFWLNDDIADGFYYQDTFHGTTLQQEGGEVYATWIFDQARVPTAELRVNGATVRTDAAFVNTDLSSNARLGSRFTGESPTNFDGRMSEYFFYNRTLDANEIATVENYLKNKWGF